MTGNHFISTAWRRWPPSRGRAVARLAGLALVAAAGLFLWGQNGFSQEALRISLAGDFAAESRQQAASTLGYYNLLLGPVAWRFGAGLEIDYNDNVHAEAQNSEGDIVIHPNLTAAMNWPVTTKNTLNFTIGAGYSYYLQHSDLNQLYINPGSGLAFDIYVGDFVINLHDRLSVTENSYQNQSSSGNTIYASLQNDAGMTALWDLNKAALEFGYDHVNYISLNASGQQAPLPDAASENVFLNAGLRVLPEILAGVEAGGGAISYERAGTNSLAANSPDATQWNAGAFCSAKISEYLDVRLDAGYTVFTPDSTSTNFTASTGYYFQFEVTHRVNRFVSYSLSAGHSLDFSYSGQPFDRYFANLTPQWNILRNYSISTPVGWERSSESYSQGVNYDQYTAGITIGRQLTQKLSGSVGYRFIKESSSLSNQNFINNIVSLSFSYQF